MIKKYWIYAFFIFAVALFAFTRFQSQQQKNADQTNTTVQTFHTAIGWGYDIYKNNSLYIHQEYMPAIEGRKGFATEADAKKIGALVMEKMKTGGLPVITREDLSACISLSQK